MEFHNFEGIETLKFDRDSALIVNGLILDSVDYIFVEDDDEEGMYILKFIKEKFTICYLRFRVGYNYLVVNDNRFSLEVKTR